MNQRNSEKYRCCVCKEVGQIMNNRAFSMYHGSTLIVDRHEISMSLHVQIERVEDLDGGTGYTFPIGATEARWLVDNTMLIERSRSRESRNFAQQCLPMTTMNLNRPSLVLVPSS